MKYTEEIEKYKKELKAFIESNPGTYSRRIKRNNPKLYKFILENTPDTLKLSTRMYWILNDIYDFPRCEICGKEFKNGIQFNRGYPRYCRKCSNSVYSDRTKHARKTNLERFGSISNFGNKENREKGKQTLLKHYGVDHNWKSQEIRNVGKNTCEKKYGDANFNNREKCKQTKLKRYGDENYVNSELARKTWTKHIIDNPNFLEERLRKTKTTKLKRYGDENYNNHRQTKETLIKKYGMLHGLSPKYIYHGKKFDSSYELAYYIWLEDHKIDFKYPCPYNFEFKNEDTGKDKTYCPDFLVDGNIVEIKGDHFFKDKDPKTNILVNPFDVNDSTPKYKMECMKKHNVVILTNKDCEQYLKYVITNYGSNFLNSCRLKK